MQIKVPSFTAVAPGQYILATRFDQEYPVIGFMGVIQDGEPEVYPVVLADGKPLVIDNTLTRFERYQVTERVGYPTARVV